MNLKVGLYKLIKMELYELVSKIESEEEDEELPKARIPERYEKLVNHRTEVGEIVFSIYGKNAPSLIYKECFDFQNAMLAEGYQFWVIRNKLTDALKWCKSKNASHASLKTLLAKIKQEMK